jgi:hypothetical protein
MASLLARPGTSAGQRGSQAIPSEPIKSEADLYKEQSRARWAS